MKKKEIKENIQNIIVEVVRLVVTVFIAISIFKVVCENEYNLLKFDTSRVSEQENFKINDKYKFTYQ